MRIVIDLQGAQSASRYRGIGRYSLSLVLSILHNAEEHDIWLVLNAAFPVGVMDIRQQLQGLLPTERICVFDIPAPVAERNPSNEWRARAAEKLREYFIQQLKPDIVLITSLFEGYNDDAVTAVDTLYSSERTAVILYDLVPMLNPEIYLSSTIQKQYYYRKIDSLKRASLLLAISDYSRQSAIEHLNLPAEHVINVSSAVNTNFRPKNYTTAEITALHQRYGIKSNFILYVPGGFDVRKNFANLITAYSLLSTELRAQYQLVISSKIDEIEQIKLEKMATRLNLKREELILTGYLPENDLIALYNLTTLFVFPSKQEGFGLPILEAMACGACVIGANNSSIPEVIGCQEALFYADSPQSIADKVTQVLTDEKMYSRLRTHGLEQAKKFSWDETAKRALRAMEKYVSNFNKQTISINSVTDYKPRLAFVSPLPPERTGIADYSAELLPALTKYYHVELINDQNDRDLIPEFANLPRRSINWFNNNADSYDRIIYQFGNSPFHTHMFALLQQYPGVVVLHDFFLSGVLAYEEISGNLPGIWSEALYHSHGYSALQTRFAEDGVETARKLYPSNLSILQNDKGIIVHSHYSQQLAHYWYGKNAADNWYIIPQLCAAPNFTSEQRLAARRALGIKPDTFLVCSFGFIDPTKLTAELLEAWLTSALAQEEHCELVLVGANHGGDYGQQIVACIRDSGLQTRIRITGWLEKADYLNYLYAADVSVQLRSLSRGETSRSVLECMSYGIATIANANGSMAELPNDAVWLLADHFKLNDLQQALETLWQDPKRRQQLAEQGRATILKEHQPTLCAERYFQTLETIYQNTAIDLPFLLKSIASLDQGQLTTADWQQLAQAIAISTKPTPAIKQILVDVTSIRRHDLKTGIERVVRAQLIELIKNPPVGYRIEPVYFTNESNYWHCRYARTFTLNLLNIPTQTLVDAPIDIQADDIFYAADFAPYELTEAAKAGLFLRWRALGLKINVLVYDLLPILKPNFFPSGADITHTAWLKEISNFADQLIGISSAVAEELKQWLKENPPSHNNQLKITAVPLGADISASVPTTRLPDNADEILQQIAEKISFLMVGTIEPRKGYGQTLAAFEELWLQGQDVQLIIVGKEGWQHLANSERRTLPEIMTKLKQHPQLNKRLFWLTDVSDEFLQKIYTASKCLIVASEGEGFGLPIIEAARHQIPIIVRDIPVFNEVAGKNAYYFSGLNGTELTKAINDWLNLYKIQQAPTSNAIHWLTWQQNVDKLKKVLLSHGNLKTNSVEIEDATQLPKTTVESY